MSDEEKDDRPWLCRHGLHWTKPTGNLVGLAELWEERVCRRCGWTVMSRITP